MEINYDKLVKEWSNRMSGRAPIYTNRYHRTVLREVMKDFGYPLWLLGEIAQKKQKATPAKEKKLLKKLGMKKYPQEIDNVYNGYYKTGTLSDGGGKTAFPKKKTFTLNDLKLYATKFDKPLFVTTAASVVKVRTPYGLRICQLGVSGAKKITIQKGVRKGGPSDSYFEKVSTLYQFVTKMGKNVLVKDKLPPGIGYEKMQVDNLIDNMATIFPMSNMATLDLNVDGIGMGVKINDVIKVPGSPKADISLGADKKPNFYISYKHGDYYDATGKELPASFQQYGSVKSFFDKQFISKAQGSGMETLINDFLDACIPKATYNVKNVTGIRKTDDLEVELQIDGKTWKKAPTQSVDIWSENFTWVENVFSGKGHGGGGVSKTNLHIVDKSGFSYRRALLNKGADGEKIAMMSIFGLDYGSGKPGINNVDILMQDSTSIQVEVDVDKNTILMFPQHYMLNPDLTGSQIKFPKFAKQYEPYFVIRYTGSMNIGWNGGKDLFVGARFLVNPESQSKGGTDI